MKKYLSILAGLTLLLGVASSLHADPPSLETDKSVDPTTIYLPGAGVPDQATVTLTVTGMGEPQVQAFPIDVMLVMDKSGSMQGQKMNDAKVAAMYFCSLLDQYLDQSGLVSFSDWATLDQQLTRNHYLTILAINALVTGGYTAIGSAIYTAQDELVSARHRPKAEPIMVILSDGDSNQGPDPIPAANSAKAQGTIIYAIGLGDQVNEPLMREIASDPDSEYYYFAPSSEDLDSIYRSVHEHMVNLAARDAVATEILAEHVHYVLGSFSEDPVSVCGDTAVWDLGNLNIGDRWVVTFDITASDTGHLPVDDYPSAQVTYLNFLGYPDGVPFPQRYIDVLPASAVEEHLERVQGGVVSLQVSPNPFSSFSTIRYSVTRSAWVTLEVYNLVGELVRTVAVGLKPAGTYVVGWDTQDNLGREVPSGVYLLRLKTDGLASTHKMIVLR